MVCVNAGSASTQIHEVVSSCCLSYKMYGIYDHILQWTDIDGFLSSLNSLFFISGPGKLMLVWHRLALSESIAFPLLLQTS